MTFKVGAQILTYGSTWDEALDTVRLLDDLGYAYVWGHDHLYSTGGDPYQGFFETAWSCFATRTRSCALTLRRRVATSRPSSGCSAPS